MFRNNTSVFVIFLTLGLLATNAQALTCKSYGEVAAKLAKKYGERMMFSGFTNSAENNMATSVYEFWANPNRGNWSLLAHKLFLIQVDETVISKSCAFIVKSGKEHRLRTSLQSRPALTDEPVVVNAQSDAVQPDAVQEAIESQAAVASAPTTNTVPTPFLNCIPRAQHAKALKDRYNEVPVLQALADDQSMMEVFSSKNSWTITQAKLREVRSSMNGMPVVEKQTGQRIHQLCSDPAYSGKTWSLLRIEQDHI